jgi:hypothetical protein
MTIAQNMPVVKAGGCTCRYEMKNGKRKGLTEASSAALQAAEPLT